MSASQEVPCQRHAICCQLDVCMDKGVRKSCESNQGVFLASSRQMFSARHASKTKLPVPDLHNSFLIVILGISISFRQKSSSCVTHQTWHTRALDWAYKIHLGSHGYSRMIKRSGSSFQRQRTTRCHLDWPEALFRLCIAVSYGKGPTSPRKDGMFVQRDQPPQRFWA